MITQNLIPAFVSKMNMPKEGQKSSESKESLSSQFKDTLDLAVKKSTQRQNSNNSYDKYSVDTKSRHEQRLQKKSSGEAAGTKEKGINRSNASEKTSDMATQRAEGRMERATAPKDECIESKIKDDVKFKEKVKALGKALSEVLGISTEELTKLMALLNINLEELDGGVNTEIAAHKISDFLSLNTDQEITLSKIIAFVQKEVEQAFKDTEAAPEGLKYSMKYGDEVNGAKSDNAEVEVVTENAPVIKNELVLKVAQALKEIENKLNENPDSFLRQITAKVEEVLEEGADASGMKTPDKKDESIEQVTVKADVEDGSKVEVVKASSGETSENKDTASREEKDSKEASIASKDSISRKVMTKDSESDNVQFEAIPNENIQKTTVQTKLEQIKSGVPVTKKEIVEQVIEKAKVVISDEKSEMVIDLKPDHLGKLEMKIVTERGMVIAKFVAENEQVKAALESNMNMLKESLEKQGFSVEGFSVTVGDNKDRGYSRDNMNQDTASRRVLKDKLQVSGVAGVEGAQKIHESVNPYSYGDSSINLTA